MGVDMMKGNLTYYFIVNPLIIFLVYALSPILFHKEEYTSMKDTFGILLFYYVLISGYYFMDVVSERMKKNGKDKQ
jgi:hypothetical protein